MNNTREIFENFPSKDYYDLLLRKEYYSYYIDRDVSHHVECIKSELEEVLEAVENWQDNIWEEMNDIIYNTLQLLQSLLKKWHIDETDIKMFGKFQKDKVYKRQPFLKENQKPESFDDEHLIRLQNKNGKTST